MKKAGADLVRRRLAPSADCRSTVTPCGVQVVLETEVSNEGALRLYGKLDFFRDKRLRSYYMNGGDAYRLKLWLKPPAEDTGVYDGVVET
jgi:ribosomal protein S18 acetylase RimI-like enzyme